jgi:hypothetical protein
MVGEGAHQRGYVAPFAKVGADPGVHCQLLGVRGGTRARVDYQCCVYWLLSFLLRYDIGY